MNNLLKEKLYQLQGEIKTIEALQKAKGETFNLFSILGMERLEVKTHSAFIFELIDNNKGSHMQGDKYLRLFISDVLKINKFEFNNVVVHRELYAADDGRIDITIENKDHFILIEMKIDATDQKNQLNRYMNFSNRKGKKSKIYYLTLDGKDASENSLEESKDSIYEKISFEKNIRDWLQSCIEASATLPIIRESIVQYKKLIEKITNISNEEIKMEIIEMINNPKIAEAATLMSNNIGLAWARREAIFWDKLYDYIENYMEKNDWVAYGGEIFYDDKDNWRTLEDLTEQLNNKRSNQNYEVGFYFEKTFNDKGISFQMYQYNSQEDIMYQLDDVENLNLEDLAKDLLLLRKNKNHRYDKSQVGVSFFGKGSSTPTYNLFDDNFLDEISKKAAKVLIEKLQIIEKYFNKSLK